MITHLVIFTWIPGITAEQLSRLRDGFDRLAQDLSESTAIRHGTDLGFRGSNGDYALVATFPDRLAWEEYQADPRHIAFVRDVIDPFQTSRLAVQF